MYFLTKEFPEYYRYHGRKISKKISNSNLNLLYEFFNHYSLDDNIISYHKNNILKKKKIIELNNSEALNIEIGFGDGEHLIKKAISKPHEMFIGVEVYINGIVKVLKSIIENEIKNIRLCNVNGMFLVKALPHSSVDNLFLINPDPWVKKRHHKRRIISLENLKFFNRIMKTKNSIYITTDSQKYFNDIKEILANNEDLLGHFSQRALTKKDILYDVSRYQRKAIKNGGKIYQLTI